MVIRRAEKWGPCRRCQINPALPTPGSQSQGQEDLPSVAWTPGKSRALRGPQGCPMSSGGNKDLGGHCTSKLGLAFPLLSSSGKG